MKTGKYTLLELEKAITYFKKLSNSEVSVKTDEKDRIIIQGSDMSANIIVITIFDSGTAKMAEVSKTERL
jgi:hypothetical protein